MVTPSLHADAPGSAHLKLCDPLRHVIRSSRGAAGEHSRFERARQSTTFPLGDPNLLLRLAPHGPGRPDSSSRIPSPTPRYPRPRTRDRECTPANIAASRTEVDAPPSQSLPCGAPCRSAGTGRHDHGLYLRRRVADHLHPLHRGTFPRTIGSSARVRDGRASVFGGGSSYGTTKGCDEHHPLAPQTVRLSGLTLVADDSACSD
jgi:hypothetical protein